MNKDKEPAQAEQVASQVSSPLLPGLPKTLPEPPNPLTEAINTRWEELQTAEYEGQTVLFYQTLAEEPALRDREMAFEISQHHLR